MTIGQYVAKFDELFKFFSYLKNNSNSCWKATKFEWGLRPEIREKVSTLEIKDFATLVNKCRKQKRVSWRWSLREKYRISSKERGWWKCKKK